MARLAGAVSGLALLAGSAVAQAVPPCDAPVFLDGVAEGTQADRVHRIEAWPGAFGGRVECLRGLSEGEVEQYWVEVLPGGDSTEEHVAYTEGRITYFIRFTDTEGQARPVADCSRGAAGGYVCRVDLAAGKGLFLVRFFDEALQFTSIRVMALPASGAVSGALWARVAGEVEAGRMAMEMALDLPGEGRSYALAREAESAPGHPIWGFSGDPAWELMEALYTRRPALALQTRVTEGSGAEQVTTTATHEIPPGTVSYLLDKLAKVEELMVSDLEATRKLKY